MLESQSQSRGIYATTKDRRDREDPGPYLRRKKPSLRKHCYYYSKAAKLEFKLVILKAWHSSLKFEIDHCYFNKTVPF